MADIKPISAKNLAVESKPLFVPPLKEVAKGKNISKSYLYLYPTRFIASLIILINHYCFIFQYCRMVYPKTLLMLKLMQLTVQILVNNHLTSHQKVLIEYIVFQQIVRCRCIKMEIHVKIDLAFNLYHFQ